MQRGDVKLLERIMDASLLLAEGNIEALRLLQQFLQHEKFWLLMFLDDMNIRGEQINLAYNNWCVGDYKIFEDCVQKRDDEMIAYINKHSICEHIAVKYGGSKAENRRTKENYNVIQFKKDIQKAVNG